MNKKQLRQEVREKLHSLSKDNFNYQCTLIAQQLYQREEWKQAKTIAITISNELEVDTIHIIKQAWLENKKVAVPKCNSLDKSMSFRYIDDFNQLETVYFNLKEPIENQTTEAAQNVFDIMIVPGIVFESSGYRIGFGGGYYDRFLEHYKGLTLSLLFEQQLYQSIPHHEYDIPVHMLILPNGVIETNG